MFKENFREAEYKMTIANLSHDFKEAVHYNLRKNKIESNRHVAEALVFQKCFVEIDILLKFKTTQAPFKVLHLRDQLTQGLVIADKLMEKRAMVLCTDKGQRDSLSALLRRMHQDCGFDSVDTEKVHHIGFCDLSKWGRLSVPEVDEVASWALRTLNQHPEYSNLDKEVDHGSKF